MSGREWVRLDCNLPTHDKTLALLTHKQGHRALCAYVLALAWSGGQGTDGHIPRAALPMVQGDERTAALLVDVGMWEPNGNGWIIHNWHKRQESTEKLERKKAIGAMYARKGNCMRRHESGCRCWEEP